MNEQRFPVPLQAALGRRAAGSAQDSSTGGSQRCHSWRDGRGSTAHRGFLCTPRCESLHPNTFCQQGRHQEHQEPELSDFLLSPSRPIPTTAPIHSLHCSNQHIRKSFPTHKPKVQTSKSILYCVCAYIHTHNICIYILTHNIGIYIHIHTLCLYLYLFIYLCIIMYIYVQFYLYVYLCTVIYT